MTFETKEQVLERVMSAEKPKCPHCGVEMNLWEVPPVPFGDGLGWGTPYLYLCFNDDCSLYVEGWDNIETNYGHKSSYRCLCYPGEENFECMPVFGSQGGKGQIIDEQVIIEQELLKEATKKGFSILADSYTSKDWMTALNLLIDASQPARVRIKAAEMLGDIGELDVIDPLKNCTFGNELLQTEVEKAIGKIHKRYFTRECPFCAEIIKKRAKICKHCSKDVAGL
jgi:hypothetical protein